MKTEKRNREPAPRCFKYDRNGLVRCRVCGCTDVDPCDPPCCWIDSDLCSTCCDAIIAVAEFRLNARRANITGLLREVYETERTAEGDPTLKAPSRRTRKGNSKSE